MLVVFGALCLINFGCSSDHDAVTVSADGVRISYSDQGRGKPAILLVHGWSNDNTIWDRQLPILSEKYHVVAIDLAGHGKSGSNRKEWSMSAFGEDVAAVVRKEKLKNVILVGFSIGGAAILEAAKIVPDKVSGLILVDALNNPEEQYSFSEIHGIEMAYMDLAENPSNDKAMALGFYIRNPQQSFQKMYKMLDRDQTGWRESLRDFFRWSNKDCIGSLEAASAPIIAINGDHTNTLTDNFRKYVPSFEVKILSGTGHILMWDVTEEFNRVLEESIQDIVSAE